MIIKYIFFITASLLCLAGAFFIGVYLPAYFSHLSQIEFKRQMDIKGCSQKAQDHYLGNWNTSCTAIHAGNECFLEPDVADKLDDSLYKQKDDCYKRFAK